MSLRLVPTGLVLGCVLLLPAKTLRAAEAPSEQYVQMIVKLIANPDREFRAAGLEQVRTGAKGSAHTQQFAAELMTLNPEGQIALLNALADRGDSAARSAVISLSGSSPDGDVRAAALGTLGRLGTPDDLPLLIKALESGSKGERDAARRSLVEVRGDGINAAVAAQLAAAPAKSKAALLEVLATRRAADQMSVFAAATLDDESRVRRAAMAALGQMGRPDQLAQMLPGVLKAPKGYERDAAEKNIALVCDRIENQDQRAAALIVALNAVDAASRDQLLSLVGRVGGGKLINFVAEIASGPDSSRRQLAIDALSKWPDASVADKLLEITTAATDPAERNQAFRAYLKVSAARDNRSDKERLNRLKQAMQVAKTPEQVALVINRVRTAYDVDSVRFVLPYVDQPQFSQVACETIVEILHHREVRDPNKAEVDKVLDKVIETSKDPVVVERAKRYKRGETWQRPTRRSRL